MIGLYIHIPFCVTKCKYCDFASYTDRFNLVTDYIDAVIDESKRYAGETADTVFIGGGTPSSLPLGEMTRLVNGISKNISIEKDAEFTVEANPNSISAKKAAEYFSLGVNRISLGLQTANEALLKRIGRTHNLEDFLDAIDILKGTGFENINVDMIYSLPDQTVEDVETTAKLITTLPVTHVSAYALKLEEGTLLFKENPVLPDEELDRRMFYKIRDVLKECQINRYEISNFAKEGYECRHNLKYWRVEDYIGLGAAAHSCYRGRRFSNSPSLEKYIENNRSISSEQQNITSERIMLKLRLLEGLPLCELPEKREVNNAIKYFIDNKAAKILDDRLILTDRGMDIQNYIVSDLFLAMDK